MELVGLELGEEEEEGRKERRNRNLLIFLSAAMQGILFSMAQKRH